MNFAHELAITRGQRIMNLGKMARKGMTESKLYNKALAYGVTDKTARSYIRALYARGELQ